MIQAWGADTVKVDKVKGQLRLMLIRVGFDRLGTAEADSAADLGRRHQPESVMDARRILLQVGTHWHPIVQHLHRFMIAVSWVTVNHEDRGGTAPDPLVWDQGGRRKHRKVDIGVNVDLASLPGPPGPPGFLHGPCVQVHGGCFCGADIAAWPYSVSLLCKLFPFRVLCIGLLRPRIWVTLVFPIWRS